NAQQNIVSSSFPLTRNGTWTFVPGYGYQGDGSTGWIGTAFVPSVSGNQNGMAYGYTIINNRTTLDGYCAMGAVTVSSIDDFSCPLFTDGKDYGSLNAAATSVNVVDPNVSAKGNFVVDRTSSTA